MARGHWTRRLLVLLVDCVAVRGAVLAQDMVGAADHPGIKRLAGGSVVGGEARTRNWRVERVLQSPGLINLDSAVGACLF